MRVWTHSKHSGWLVVGDLRQAGRGAAGAAPPLPLRHPLGPMLSGNSSRTGTHVNWKVCSFPGWGRRELRNFSYSLTDTLWP